MLSSEQRNETRRELIDLQLAIHTACAPSLFSLLALMFEQSKQGLFGFMEIRSPMSDELFQTLKVLVDYLAALESVEDLGIDVGGPAYCWSVAEYLGGFLDRLDDLLLFC